MIGTDDYHFLCSLLLETTGLSVGSDKEYLIESRLVPVARAHRFASVADLVARLRSNPSPELVRAVGEAMATYESSFFRDGSPFELLRSRIIPDVMERRAATRPIRIWSAAASTGQEAYSVAMILDDLPLGDQDVEIIATDYSRTALERARSGVYSTFDVQRGLSADERNRFFVRAGTEWRLRESTRARVTFTELNLLHSYGSIGTCDIILCRNVLIYFDLRTRRSVLERMASSLSPHGYLLLGAAESAIGVSENFVRVPELPTSVYRKFEADVGTVVV